MHMDNPMALANTVINDLLNLEGDDKLPVLPLSEQQGVDQTDYQRQFEQDQKQIYLESVHEAGLEDLKDELENDQQQEECKEKEHKL